MQHAHEVELLVLQQRRQVVAGLLSGFAGRPQGLLIPFTSMCRDSHHTLVQHHAK